VTHVLICAQLIQYSAVYRFGSLSRILPGLTCARQRVPARTGFQWTMY